MSVLDRQQKVDEAPSKGLAIPGRKPKSGPTAQLAAPPRARLLPPEVGRRKRDSALRRRVWACVVVGAVVAAGGTAAAYFFAGQSHVALDSAQSEQLTLQKKVAGFADVKQTKADLKARGAAVIVGGAADVDWSSYLQQVQSTLPAGLTMTDADVKLLTADAVATGTGAPAAAAAGDPDNPAIAALTFTASSDSVPSIPDWIDSLSSKPGFLSAQPGAVKLDPASGVYTATVTMQVGADALSYKYLPKPKEAAK